MCECLLFNLFITFFTAYFNINHTKNILLLSRNLLVKVFGEREILTSKSPVQLSLSVWKSPAGLFQGLEWKVKVVTSSP